MVYNKIRIQDDKVTLGWVETKDSGAKETGQVTVGDPPSPGFRKALQEFEDPARAWLELDGKKGKAFTHGRGEKGFVVIEVALSGADNDVVQVKGYSHLAWGGASMNTPNYRPVGPEGTAPGFYGKDVDNLVAKLQAFAKEYHAGGQREQLSLTD